MTKKEITQQVTQYLEAVKVLPIQGEIEKLLTKTPKTMKTHEIITNISANGGFDNFRKWNTNEIKQWVLSNYNCSRYVANKVACYLSNN